MISTREHAVTDLHDYDASKGNKRSNNWLYNVSSTIGSSCALNMCFPSTAANMGEANHSVNH